jgi:putative hemolysin
MTLTLSEILLYCGLTLIGFVFSALYSGSETGLYLLNTVRLTVGAAHRVPAAVRLRRELSDLNRLLMVLLLGNNSANYLGTFGLAALMAGLGLGDWSVIILQAIIVTPLLFVFGETLPKELFRTHTDKWTYRLSPFIVISRWAFTIILLLPIVQFVTIAVTRLARLQDSGALSARQRVSQMIKEGVGAGVLTETQTTIADRALAMRSQHVSGVMVPWRQVVTLDVDADRTTREAAMRRRNFTRLPVVDRRGRVVGLLSWIDAVLERDRPTRDLLAEPLTFHPGTPLLEAISTMRRERQAMAVVIAPQTGRPIGLVTLKDLVEPLTGRLTVW